MSPGSAVTFCGGSPVEPLKRRTQTVVAPLSLIESRKRLFEFVRIRILQQ